VTKDLDIDVKDYRIFGNDHGRGACNLFLATTWKDVNATLTSKEVRQLRDWLTEVLEDE